VLLNVRGVSLLFSLMIFNAYGFNCTNTELVENELLLLEFSGAHLTVKSKCLDQSKFKTLLPEHSPSEESLVEAKFFISKMDDVKILSKTRLDTDLYELKFEFNTTSGKKMMDTIEYLVNTHPRAQKIEGCALILKKMKQPTQLISCSKKDNSKKVKK
jgi:hypothetical protein